MIHLGVNRMALLNKVAVVIAGVLACSNSFAQTSFPRAAESSAAAPANGLPADASAATIKAWADLITLSGDFRFRLQHDVGTAAVDANQNDHARIRARLKANATVNDKMNVVFRLVTGGVTGAGAQYKSYSNHSDLGQVGSKKEFALDLAFLEYRPFAGLQVQLGKMQTLFWTAGATEIMWGYPWTQDGINLRYTADLGSGFKPYAIFTYSAFDEAGGKTPEGDSDMIGGQIVAPIQTGSVKTTVAVGSYNYTNIAGTNITDFYYPGNSTTADGNTVANGTYANEFRMIDGAAEVTWDMGFAPLTGYFEYIQNTAASKFNTGSIAGVKIGSLKEVGGWLAEYNYRDVQADATLGIAGETIFLGGGTNVNGHLIRVANQTWTRANIGLEYETGTRANQTGSLCMIDLNAAF